MLDVGTGSGYHAALLSLLAGHVYTIERHRQLSAVAEQAIRDLGIDNVTFVVGDGWDGLPSEAPFDAINVAAASDAEPYALERQLADGGRLVAPVGSKQQHLLLTRRSGDRLIRRQLEAVQFVPLVHGTADVGASRITSIATGLASTSTNRRPSPRHTAPSVPEPANGSRHHAPGRDEAATIRRSTPSGFCVGYPVFSRPLVGTIVWNQTSVGRLPRAAFSALTSPGAMYGSRSTASASKKCPPGVRTYTRIVSCLAGQRRRGLAP